MSTQSENSSDLAWVSDTQRRHKVSSAVTLFAFGDAWGYVTEFMKYPEILKHQPEVPKVLKVSDDTQMSLYTMSALKTLLDEGIDLRQDYFDLAADAGLQNYVRRLFAEEYVSWARDPDNNRAPGMTCLRAVSEYENIKDLDGITTGAEGAANASLGCGTIMRAPWIGLLPYDEKTVATLAILQAQTTHGDPVGWIVSAIAALLVRAGLEETEPQGTEGERFSQALSALDTVEALNTELTEHIRSSRVEGTDPFDKVRSALTGFRDSWTDIEDRLSSSHSEMTDITTVFGEGWIADEALYAPLGVLSLYGAASEESILMGIKRLIYTNGDSDSIAAVGGALFGAENTVGTVSTETLEQMTTLFEDRYRMEMESTISFINSQWDQ